MAASPPSSAGARRVHARTAVPPPATAQHGEASAQCPLRWCRAEASSLHVLLVCARERARGTHDGYASVSRRRPRSRRACGPRVERGVLDPRGHGDGEPLKEFSPALAPPPLWPACAAGSSARVQLDGCAPRPRAVSTSAVAGKGARRRPRWCRRACAVTSQRVLGSCPVVAEAARPRTRAGERRGVVRCKQVAERGGFEATNARPRARVPRQLSVRSSGAPHPPGR
jgi:hypothetical protein